jgi:peptidyl-prolyl cis-trans isomerase B (cyclophilin B)
MALLGRTLFALALWAPLQSDAPDSTLTIPPEEPLASKIYAELRPDRALVPVGSEVMLEFVVVNRTDEIVTLTVPGALVGAERGDLGMGLPLEHVYSGVDYRGLEIASELNPLMGDRITRKPEFPVPPVRLAPFASIGLRFDVARFYPGLHQEGIYQLGWRPYGGTVVAPPVVIEVVQYKQVVMQTDLGPVTMQLLYEKAPLHVANFLDLVNQRFYNGKTIHAVFANQFILGGSPEGEGRGKRPDGQTIPPEFNDTPFELGTVGMALLPGDPNSGSCQFFICLSRQAAWDGRYTAFAQVSGPESLATLRKLGEVETDENRRPKAPLIIKNMAAVDVAFVPKERR